MNALSLSSNIVRRGAVYYIRVRVPSDLLDYYDPKKEITYSLKTKDPREAKRKGNLERVKIDQRFEEARRSLMAQTMRQERAAVDASLPVAVAASPEMPALLSPLELERLSLLYLHHALADDEAARATPKSPETIERERQQAQEREDLIRELSEKKGIPYTPPSTPPTIRPVGLTDEDIDAKRAYAERFIHDAPFFIAKGETYPVHHLVDALIKREHLHIAKESPAYYQLALAIMRTESKAQEAILKRLSGEWVETPLVAVPTLPITLNNAEGNRMPPASPHDDNPLFSEVWERYLAERKPAPKTAQDFGTAVRRFIEINGDLPVQSIKARHVRMFKDTLLKCPSRVPKELQNLPILKVIKRLESRKKEEPYPKTLSPKTINDKALTAIKAVLSHAVDNGFIETNPAHQIRAVDPAQHNADNAGPSRIPYDMDDIRGILRSPLFHEQGTPSNGILKRLTQEEKRDYQRLVLLGIFTGARLEEIGQLDIADIREEEGITYIFIHADAATGRRIKNKTSRRKVPVHPFLLDRGFLPTIRKGEGCGSAQCDSGGGGGGKLFPTLSSKTDTLTAPFSKWWRRYTVSIGVYTPQKTFHSFRHTFKRTLRDAGIDGKLTDALQGHAGTSIADNYGRDAEGMGYSMPVLFRALCEGMEKGGLEQVVKESLAPSVSSPNHGKK